MKKVGLALGGGSAHGVAHLGVLEVLEENHIPIDMICGCSAGSIVGALYCAGSDMHMVKRICETLDINTVLDLTIPRMGLFKGDKAEAYIETMTGGKTVADCKIPFSAVAVDLVRSELVRLDEGKLSRLCRASFSLPGIFEPCEIGERVFVDAGILNRVPVVPVREMGAEYVIAVDVGFRGSVRQKPSNISEVLSQAFETCDWYNVRHDADLANAYLAPFLEDIPSSNLSGATECVERGRDAAEQLIPQIKKDLGIE